MLAEVVAETHLASSGHQESGGQQRREMQNAAEHSHPQQTPNYRRSAATVKLQPQEISCIDNTGRNNI